MHLQQKFSKKSKKMKDKNKKDASIPMSKNCRKSDIDRKEIFDKYYETFYKDSHGWRDYELTSKGYAEWYYDCLPTDKTSLILDIGCGDDKFLFFLSPTDEYFSKIALL